MPQESQLDPQIVAERYAQLFEELGRPASSQELAEMLPINSVTNKPFSRQHVLALLNETERGRELVEQYTLYRVRRNPPYMILTEDQEIVRWLRDKQRVVGIVASPWHIDPKKLYNRRVYTTMPIPAIVSAAKAVAVLEVNGIPWDLIFNDQKNIDLIDVVYYLIRRKVPNW